MAENIVISEGGIGRKFHPVAKLQINNQDESQSLWVAEETLNTGSINVTSNGVYSAVEDELFAYDEVTVDVAEDITDPSDTNSVTGKDSDGNDYEYSLGEDGNLDVSMIPAAIHIVVKPRKLKYEDGETIDFSGIHVYLMDGNNRRYVDASYPTGEIPFDELIFPVTVADGGDGTYTATSDIAGISDYVPFVFGSVLTSYYEDRQRMRQYTAANGGVIAGFQIEDGTNLQDVRATTVQSSGYTTYTRDGKTVYFNNWNHLGSHYDCSPVNRNNPPSALFDLIAWTMIYGDITSSGTQEIPVQWMRSDGEILEDTFEIEVGEGGEPGPPEPDPWAGNYDVSWNGHTYNINRRIVPEVHYANGYCWQEGTTEYTVEQAVGFGWLIRVGM